MIEFRHTHTPHKSHIHVIDAQTHSAAKESFESAFYVAEKKVEATEKEPTKGISKALEPFSTMKKVNDRVHTHTS
jgi:hypothetical protein